MRVEGTFEVVEFNPAPVDQPVPVETGLPVGISMMDKRYSGGVSGRSSTIFTSAFDPERGGTYVAMESFEGSLDDRQGTFNFVHSATSSGTDRTDEYFAIVPASGTGELTGISGTGGISISDAGEHTIWFEYALGDD